MVTGDDQCPFKPEPPRKTVEDEEHAIVRAAGQIGFFTLLSRITGLLRDVIIGSVFGVGMQTDAFFAAFRIPNLLRRLVGEGAATAALVPVITEYLAQRSRAEAMAMVGALWGVGLVLVGVLTIIVLLCAGPLVYMFVPGFTGDKLELTVALTRVMFAYLPCIGGMALAMGVLHALRHFAAPAFAPVLFNLAVISCVVWLSGALAEPAMSLAYGVVLGGVCQVAWQIPALLRCQAPLWPRWEPRHPAVRRVAMLLLPLVFGAGIYQMNQIISTLLASFLEEGSVSALWYATRLFEFPVGVFVVALSTAALPSLAAQAHSRDDGKMRDSLGFALRLVNLVSLPATVGLVILAEPLSSVLFFHGAFSASDVKEAAAALQGYAVGLWAVAATRMLSTSLYALQDTRTPLLGGIVAFLAKIIFSLMLMGPIVLPADAGVLVQWLASLNASLTVANGGTAGLALATSLSAIANLAALTLIARRRFRGFSWSSWSSSLVWSAAGCGGMSLPLWWVTQRIGWVDAEASLFERIETLTFAILVGSVSYFIIAWRGGRNEFLLFIGMLPQRALRFLPQFLQPRE